MMADRRSESTTAAGMSVRTSCSVAAACSSAAAVELELLSERRSSFSAAALSAEVSVDGVPAPTPMPAISTRVPADEPRFVGDELWPCDGRSAARCGLSSDGGTSMWKAGLPPAPSATELNGLADGRPLASASCRHVQALPEPMGLPMGLPAVLAERFFPPGVR